MTANKTKPRIERIRAIVDHHQHAKIEGCRIDAFSASAIVQVHDALNPQNRAAFLALPIPKMADVAFKLINRGKRP